MFRERMRTRESNAEIDMLVAAAKAYREGRLKDRPLTQRPIVLWHTVPDESYDAARVELYLDGEAVHKDPDHDRRIDDELVHRHYFVLRFRYKPQMSDKRREEILHVLCLIVEWHLTLKSEEQRGGRIAQYGPDYEYEHVEPETEALIREILK